MSWNKFRIHTVNWSFKHFISSDILMQILPQLIKIVILPEYLISFVLLRSTIQVLFIFSVLIDIFQHLSEVILLLNLKLSLLCCVVFISILTKFIIILHRSVYSSKLKWLFLHFLKPIICTNRNVIFYENYSTITEYFPSKVLFQIFNRTCIS